MDVTEHDLAVIGSKQDDIITALARQDEQFERLSKDLQEKYFQLLEKYNKLYEEIIARKHLDEKIVKLEETVNGNGKEGLRSKVQRHENLYKIMVWVSGAFGLSAVTLIWAILTHSVEIVGKP